MMPYMVAFILEVPNDCPGPCSYWYCVLLNQKMGPSISSALHGVYFPIYFSAYVAYFMCYFVPQENAHNNY